jgi:tagaturonate reductase
MKRVLQFGTGRFMRGFVDAFIDDTERQREHEAGSAPVHRVTVVESTGSGMAARLAAQDGAYRLATRGLDQGRIVDSERVVRVIDHAIDASADTIALAEAALDPDLAVVASNATQAGYVPGGYPRKLAIVLAERARAGMPGLLIVPCELIERNGDRLRALVTDEVVDQWAEPWVAEHVREANLWTTTIVDRIVTAWGGGPSGVNDPLAVAVEPFASWVVEAPAGVVLLDHPALTLTRDVTPYALRKIRILNGAHTALVARTRGSRLEFVRQALEDPAIGDWLEALLLEEIVPALGDRIVDGAGFAASVLERFRNPFLDHRLVDIAVDHERKLELRLVSTYRDHVQRLGRPPRLLGALLEQEGVLV